MTKNNISLFLCFANILPHINNVSSTKYNSMVIRAKKLYLYSAQTTKAVQTIIVMLTEDKVTEIFFMSDEFCKFLDLMTKK